MLVLCDILEMDGVHGDILEMDNVQCFYYVIYLKWMISAEHGVIPVKQSRAQSRSK